MPLRLLLIVMLAAPASTLLPTPTAATRQAEKIAAAAGPGDTEQALQPQTAPTRQPASADEHVSCDVAPAGGPTVQLIRHGPPWPGWPALCTRLVHYLNLPKAPLDPNSVLQVQRNLQSLGYFETIDCRRTGSTRLVCSLGPAPMVKSYRLRGRVPFTLLQEDLRRRIFLRPGTVMQNPQAEIQKQEDRLVAYLISEGYFAPRVIISPSHVDGVEPNAGLHLDIYITPGADATVDEIIVRGDAIAPDNELAQLFRHTWIKGMPMRFRPAQFNDDLQAASQWLQAKGWPAAHVQGNFVHDSDRRQVRIELKVSAGSRVDIAFVGDTALCNKALAGLATFEAAGAIDPVAIDEQRQNIVRHYQTHGYVDVAVQAQTDRIDATHLKVTYRIDAGKKLPVHEVRFLGLPPLNVKTLHHDVGFLSRPSSLWRNHYWVDSYVARDVRSLTAYLRKEGYDKAKVRAERTVAGDTGGLDIVFVVDPGHRRLVGAVRLDADDGEVDRDELLARLDQRPQKPFLEQRVDNDGQQIQASLASKGYTNAQVTSHTDVSEDDPTSPVAIRHTIHLGPKAHVGGLFLRGNLRTSGHVLTQELHSRPGDPLDLAALGLARRRLRAFNIFNTVQLSPLSPQTDEPTTWLLLALEERNTRSLDGVGSFSSDYRFSIGADYRDRNLFGRTMLLTIQLRLSDASELITPKLRIGNQDLLSLNLKAPHPFGLPLDAEAQLLYRYVDLSEYRERRMGGIASLSRPLLARSACAYCPNIVGKLGYELTEAYRTDKLEAAASTQTSLVPFADTTIARIYPSVNVSRRDSPIDPTLGYNYDLRLEIGHPALAGPLHKSATAFYRILTGLQGYYPLGVPLTYRLGDRRTLGGPLVVAAAAQYSVAGPFSAHGAVPATETFGYGGDFSVRGLVNRASTQQLDNAHYLFTGSAELRWYIAPDLGFGTIQLAGFADMGTVAERLDALFAQSTLSIGPVLRYVTPIGPLSLAYGKAVMLPAALRGAPNVAPPQGRVHLTFGYSF